VETVNSFKAGVAGLGEWLVPILLVVTVCAVGYAIHQRLHQRKEGWA